MKKMFVLAASCFVMGSASVSAGIIADKNLEAAIKAVLFDVKGELKESDLQNLYVLDASAPLKPDTKQPDAAKQIKSLAGLEKAHNLLELRLARNLIEDIKPISGLKNLQSLDLSGNKITNLDPLEKLVNLQYLELSDNQVADLKPLAGLTKLSALYLGGNKITNVGPLAKLNRLQSLHLDRNQITDIGPLATTTSVDVLGLRGNQITDLKPLAKYTDLRLVMLDDNKITDLAPLVELCRKDAAGPKRFAPYMRLFLKGNPLSESAQKTQLDELKKIGVRLEGK